MRKVVAGLATFVMVVGVLASTPTLASAHPITGEFTPPSTSKYEYKRYTRSLSLRLNAASAGKPRPGRTTVLARQKRILAKAGCDLEKAFKGKKIPLALFSDDFKFVMDEFNRCFDPFYQTNPPNSTLLTHAMKRYCKPIQP